jgi:hypothetical protein
MRRILLVMSAAALMAAMMVLTAVPAFATVHPLSRSDVSNAPVGTAAETQDPPGLSGQSSADNIAQPVVSVLPPGAFTPEGDEGTNPSGGNSLNAFQDPIQ